MTRTRFNANTCSDRGWQQRILVWVGANSTNNNGKDRWTCGEVGWFQITFLLLWKINATPEQQDDLGPTSNISNEHTDVCCKIDIKKFNHSNGIGCVLVVVVVAFFYFLMLRSSILD
jgi:hypothetical protein